MCKLALNFFIQLHLLLLLLNVTTVTLAASCCTSNKTNLSKNVSSTEESNNHTLQATGLVKNSESNSQNLIQNKKLINNKTLSFLDNNQISKIDMKTNLDHLNELNNIIYTDQYVVKLNGGPELAKELSEKHGFIYLDQIFDNYYHIKHRRLRKRSLEPAHHDIHRSLVNEPEVDFVKQQTLKKRVKRDFRNDFEPFNKPSTIRRAPNSRFNDPHWPQMWYLNRGLDMNVQKVWSQNITGAGIVVTILDDGLEKDHPDLASNYDEKASYDVNNLDHDPQPRYDMLDSNRHGTRCAGEVAAVANNNFCGVGIAYDSKIGGVRMLDGDVTDAVEARSIGHANQHIDIYSASWGPDDDGKTVDGPGELATRAFIEGVNKGRNGLGSIFIWASGNGGRERDDCNCDGYTNSIWTLSISSATENGLVPWYSESCSSTLATTYSSGAYGEKQIVTTDLHHRCTNTHTGTSASAPLAAGIAALVLQANKKISWRDMQHLVVLTANPGNLQANDWHVNGVGRKVSHSFGYGLMDALAMVNLAKEWVTVPAQKICETRSNPIDKSIPFKSYVELSLEVHCDKVKYLEHVQAKINLTANRRGDIHIYLISPAGTKSTLVAERPMDNSRAGFQNWPFMSVQTWGEKPDGKWKLQIHNEGKYHNRANLKEWSLVMYGTSENPDRRRKSATTDNRSSNNVLANNEAHQTSRNKERNDPLNKYDKIYIPTILQNQPNHSSKFESPYERIFENKKVPFSNDTVIQMDIDNTPNSNINLPTDQEIFGGNEIDKTTRNTEKNGNQVNKPKNYHINSLQQIDPNDPVKLTKLDGKGSVQNEFENNHPVDSSGLSQNRIAYGLCLLLSIFNSLYAFKFVHVNV